MTPSTQDNKISNNGQVSSPDTQPKIRVYQLSLQWTVTAKTPLKLVLQS
jgi:hypothetical protein